MNNYFGPPKSRIIYAADLTSSRLNFEILDQIYDKIDVIKVSGFLAIKEGIGCIGEFKKRYNKPVFADFKVADVPHTNAKIVEMVKDQGGDAVMVHGIIGPDAIQDCITTAGNDLGIIIQLELTNPGGMLFTAPISLEIAKLAASMDVYGVQAPGNRPDKIQKIRQIVGDDMVIVCCGVGAQGGGYHSAISAGGTYPIIGRAIYNSKDPKQAISTLINN